METKDLMKSVDKEELLRALIADKARSTPISSEEDAREIAVNLKNKLGTFLETHNFKQGDLIQWKDGLRNKKKPREGEPAIVIEFLEKPEYADKSESGSAYFMEPLDLIAAFLDEDGDFVTFYFDSRRFEPFKV